jgi:RNA polymerase sigma-70 factor (ECF subfamily)
MAAAGAEPGPSPSDDELVARAGAGDEPAFEALVLRYQGRVYRLARRLTEDDGDAQDALQETFLQVHRKLGSFRGESRFSTWLYRVATNAALMQRRARARRPAEPLDAYAPRFDANGEHAATPEQLLAARSVDERLDRKRLAEKALDGLARLPDLYREAFVLRDLEELETAEVALILGLEPATVRQRVHRARLLLRGYLGALAGLES